MMKWHSALTHIGKWLCPFCQLIVQVHKRDSIRLQYFRETEFPQSISNLERSVLIGILSKWVFKGKVSRQSGFYHGWNAFFCSTYVLSSYKLYKQGRSGIHFQ